LAGMPSRPKGDTMKRKYEVMYILDQDVKEPQTVITKLNKIITAEGKILESEE
jgi:small subunit ribosomal protein S6